MSLTLFINLSLFLNDFLQFFLFCVIKFLFFFMCHRTKSRSPPTGSYPKNSDLDNREKDKELSKFPESPKHPATTYVFTVERYTAAIENHTRRNGIHQRLTPETRNKKKKTKFSNIGRCEQSNHGVISPGKADWSIDWPTILTAWTSKGLKNRFLKLILLLIKFC